MNEYRKMAEDFCKATGTKVKIVFTGMEYPMWDSKYMHNTYTVRLDRNHKTFRFKFYDSVFNTRKGIRPDKYDVLSVLEKYDVGTIDDFVREFGYEVTCGEDVKKIEATYKAVVREVKNVNRLFGDVIDQLAEIC